ncbi:MAG: hypothetical protein AB1742_11220 [bacterium]
MKRNASVMEKTRRGTGRTTRAPAVFGSAAELSGRAGAENGGTNFFCFSLTDALILEKRGIRARCIEGFLIPEHARRAQKRIFDLMRTWYLRGGTDISMFNGVSLGGLVEGSVAIPLVRTFRYALCLENIFGTHRPGAVEARLDGGDTRALVLDTLCRHHDVPLELKPPADGGATETPGFSEASVIRRTAGQKLAPVAVSLVCRLRFRKNTGRRIILVLEHGQGRFLWKHWLENKRLRGKTTLGFIKQFPPGRHAIPAALAGGAVYDAARPLSRGDEEKLNGIRAAFDGYFDTEEWKGKFAWNGVDFSGAFTPAFRLTVTGEFHRAATVFSSLTLQMKKTPPSAVLTFNDVLVTASALVSAAKLAGAETILYEHSITPCLSRRENLLRERVLTDRLLTWGRAQEELYAKECRFPAERIVTVGAPPEKAPLGKAPPGRKNGAARANVLVFAYAHSDANVTLRESTEETYFFEVMRMLAELGTGKVVVKLHPGSRRLPLYRKMTALVPADIRIELRHRENPVPLIIAADLVIGPFSTALLTALALGKRCYVYHKNEPHLIGPPFDGDPGFHARSIEELKEQILTGRTQPAAEILERFCESHDPPSLTAGKIFDAVLKITG